MAFTTGEFVRGAIAAWVSFNALFGLAAMALAGSPSWEAVGSIILVVLPISAIVSGVAAIVLGPLALLLARGLRRHRSVGVHIAAFAGFGAFVGAAVVTVYAAFADSASFAGLVLNPASGLIVGLCALAVPAGWLWAFGSRQRAARRKNGVRIDPDATYEDSLPR